MEESILESLNPTNRCGDNGKLVFDEFVWRWQPKHDSDSTQFSGHPERPNTRNATGHWVATSCGVQVELTADGKAWTVVIDTSGTTSSGAETWTAGTSSSSISIGPGSGQGGFFWVSALTNIKGTTASEAFSADVTVGDSTNTHQDLGTCSFTLQTGPLS
jgi:hypothetical protein